MEKRLKNNEQSLSDLWDNMKYVCKDIYILKEGSERKQQKIIEEWPNTS